MLCIKNYVVTDGISGEEEPHSQFAASGACLTPITGLLWTCNFALYCLLFLSLYVLAVSQYHVLILFLIHTSVTMFGMIPFHSLPLLFINSYYHKLFLYIITLFDLPVPFSATSRV